MQYHNKHDNSNVTQSEIKREKQIDAKERQKIYDSLSSTEKLSQIALRRGESKKERERLQKK